MTVPVGAARWQWKSRWVWALAGCLPLMAVGADGASAAGDWSGAVGIVSNKLSRGLSSSDGRAALQADIDYRHRDGWGASLEIAASVSDVRADEAAMALQRAWQFDRDWAAQLGVAHYAYLGSSVRRRYDRNEASLSVVWQDRWTATVAASPDTSRFGPQGLRRGLALAYDVGLRQRLAGRWALDAGIGYQDLHAIDSASYRYGSVGLSWGTGPLQLWAARVAAPGAAAAVASGAPGGFNGWAASAFWAF